MYEALFNLDSRPFPSTPRVDRYFPASKIEEALRAVSRCVDRAEGTGLVIGGPGTGKTLLCEMLATRFRDRFHVVRLDSAQLCTRRALLQNILFELNLPYRDTDEGSLRLSLIDFLEPSESSREGILLLVDEAHTLPLRLVEEIRMITNLVRDGQPRARLVLAGDATLEEHLGDPKLESLNQRIAARCYLQPLNYDETIEFVRSQISAVGGTPEQLFTDDALQAVYHAADGIPRLINQLCDHALILLASTSGTRLDQVVIEQAWADLQQLPMPAASDAQTPTSDTGIVEFGSLDDHPTGEDPFDSLDDCLLSDEHVDKDVGGEVEEEVEEVTDVVEDEVDCEASSSSSAGEPEVTPPVQPTREIDLTDQLSVIEQHFQEIESYDATLVCGDAVLDAEPIDAEPPNSEQTAVENIDTQDPESAEPRSCDPSDPFAEPFAQEEHITDHYTALEAARNSRDSAALRKQECNTTSRLKSIFTPPDALDDSSDAEAPAAEPASGEDNGSLDETAAFEESVSAADHLESPQADLELSSSQSDTDVMTESVEEEFEPVAEETPSGPGVVRARVLRSLPPDDSDLLLVVDESLDGESLEDQPERTHRRRYRDLFTRLRES